MRTLVSSVKTSVTLASRINAATSELLILIRQFDNLLLLCSQHHRLVHEEGFRIERNYRNRWFFQRPDGRAVPSCGYRAQDMIDDSIDDGIGDQIGNNLGELSELINNPSAEGFLSAVKTMPDSLPLLRKVWPEMTRT